MTNKIVTILRNTLCGAQIDEYERRIEELEQQIEEQEEDEWPDLETTQVDRQFVEDALQELDGWGLRESYWRDDGKYNLPDRDDFGRVVFHDKVNERPYKDEVYDCDNYSDHLVSLFADRYTCNAVGTIITQDGNPHAFNVVVFPDGKAELWEPQSDVIVTGSDADKYSLNGAMIRI